MRPEDCMYWTKARDQKITRHWTETCPEQGTSTRQSPSIANHTFLSLLTHPPHSKGLWNKTLTPGQRLGNTQQGDPLLPSCNLTGVGLFVAETWAHTLHQSAAAKRCIHGQAGGISQGALLRAAPAPPKSNGKAIPLSPHPWLS